MLLLRLWYVKAASGLLLYPGCPSCAYELDVEHPFLFLRQVIYVYVHVYLQARDILFASGPVRGLQIVKAWF